MGNNYGRSRSRSTQDIGRRDLLASFLGASGTVFLEGCQSRDTGLPPGELVGPSVALGHRIRDGLRPSFSEHDLQETQVVIVGGGIAGLAAARRLHNAGVEDFVVLELEREPGGTSRSGQSDVVAYPWGAHYVPAPTREFPALVRLFDEVGVFEGTDAAGDPVVAEQFRCRHPEERVFYKGLWYEGLYLSSGASVQDRHQMTRFQAEMDRWVAWRDGQGRRAFAVPMAAGSDEAAVRALDMISMAQWMDQRGFHSPRLRWWVDYACRDDYGLRLEQTSAWAGIYYFCARIPEAGAAARPFVTWPEGNGRLVRHLYSGVQAQCLLGAAATEVIPREIEGKPVVDVLGVKADSEQVFGYRADRVIFAAPQFLSRYLIRDYREQVPQYVSEFSYGAWAVANLTLSEVPRSVGFPLAWDNVLYESPSLGYVATSYQRGLDYGPAVLTYYYPLCDDDSRTGRQRLLQLDREEWAEIALADLGRAHEGIRESAQRVDVMRWGHAMIQPRPGFVWGKARQLACQPFRSIHFGHSDLSGIALFEEAFFQGTRAAEEVLVALRGRVDSIL
ncbi:MAG: twin-arginine translocation pathway signal [Planctomycetaceae bacterium]|nr:twin-arginine translocation pathway signal [Planctomycetaceae bacterium]